MTDSPTIRSTTAQSIANILLGLTLADRCYILSAALGLQAAQIITQHGFDDSDAEMMIDAIARDAKATLRNASKDGEPKPETPNHGWSWWSGHDEEYYSHGPFDTKEEALEAARQDCTGEFEDEDGTSRVHVFFCESTNPPLRLAEWIRADELLERAEDELADSDRIGADCDEGPWFKVTPDQQKDLSNRIQATCDDWQKSHGLTFTCRTFAAMRNIGDIALPHPKDDEVKE